MSPEPHTDPSATAAPGTPVPGAGSAAGIALTATPRHTGTYLLGTVALATIAALVSSGLLWQKLNAIQEQLARQSADAGAQAIEALSLIHI